jgi:hypothetical protein
MEINAALADPKMKARLAEWGATALPGSPADFGKLIAEETEKWGQSGEVRGRQSGLIQRQMSGDKPPSSRDHS